GAVLDHEVGMSGAKGVHHRVDPFELRPLAVAGAVAVIGIGADAPVVGIPLQPADAELLDHIPDPARRPGLDLGMPETEPGGVGVARPLRTEVIAVGGGDPVWLPATGGGGADIDPLRLDPDPEVHAEVA